MKLNALEFALMNNPVRAWSQRALETPVLIGPPGALHGQRVLEVGCGRGVGVEILLEQLQAAEVVAFDLDPEMVALAGKRVARFGDRAHVLVGDAERVDAPDASFDAVVDYGILHHVPNWRGALAEVARVLRPGGTFYFEEVLKGLTGSPLVRDLLDHPQDSQFAATEFLEGLAGVGLEVDEDWRRLGDIALLGRARRARGRKERPTEPTGFALPRHVHTWYGLNGVIRASGGPECDVAVEGRPLPHPSLVNRFLRRGLPSDWHVRLGAWHEEGHLQTLPVAGLSGLALLAAVTCRPDHPLVKLLAGLVGVTALWELASEAYVVAHVGWHAYRQVYSSAHSRLGLFWLGGAASALAAWLMLARRQTGGRDGEHGHRR